MIPVFKPLIEKEEFEDTHNEVNSADEYDQIDENECSEKKLEILQNL